LDKREIIEVKCKGLLGTDYVEITKEQFEELKCGDMVIVQGLDDFQEIAEVSEKGEIVRLKRREQGLVGEDLPYVIRKATDEDLARVEENNAKEKEAIPIFREKVKFHGLEMKFVDVHFQFDRKKLFFFYTANGRVDFRQLAKDLAAVFRTRIELRQIGARDEAKKIGGIGMCGREFCCTSFMTNFKRITTQIANQQNLNTSLSKMSGPCGKLKCCLSFEIETN
jgi:cell fate regulator YaaT (PSP1 superfamily)